MLLRRRQIFVGIVDDDVGRDRIDVGEGHDIGIRPGFFERLLKGGNLRENFGRGVGGGWGGGLHFLVHGHQFFEPTFAQTNQERAVAQSTTDRAGEIRVGEARHDRLAQRRLRVLQISCGGGLQLVEALIEFLHKRGRLVAQFDAEHQVRERRAVGQALVDSQHRECDFALRQEREQVAGARAQHDFAGKHHAAHLPQLLSENAFKIGVRQNFVNARFLGFDDARRHIADGDQPQRVGRQHIRNGPAAGSALRRLGLGRDDRRHHFRRVPMRALQLRQRFARGVQFRLHRRRAAALLAELPLRDGQSGLRGGQLFVEQPSRLDGFLLRAFSRLARRQRFARRFVRLQFSLLRDGVLAVGVATRIIRAHS